MYREMTVEQLIDKRDELQREKDENNQTITNIRGQLDVRRAQAIENDQPFDQAWAHRAGAAARHHGRRDQELATQIRRINQEIARRDHVERLERADLNRTIKHTRAGNLERCFVDAAKTVLPTNIFDRVMMHAEMLMEERD